MKTEKSCIWWLCLLSGVFTLPAVTLWLWECIFCENEEDEEDEEGD